MPVNKFTVAFWITGFTFFLATVTRSRPLGILFVVLLAVTAGIFTSGLIHVWKVWGEKERIVNVDKFIGDDQQATPGKKDSSEQNTGSE